MEPRALVLTIGAQPHGIVSWQKAVRLAYKGRVEVVASYQASIAGADDVFEIPAVIKLRRTIDMHRDGIKFSRSNVYQRDGYRCCYCNKRFAYAPELLTYDHVVPRSKGGKTVWENIVTACKPCNGRKDNRTPHQAGMKQHYVPYRPHALPGFRPVLVDLRRAPAEWLPYLHQHQQHAASA